MEATKGAMEAIKADKVGIKGDKEAIKEVKGVTKGGMEEEEDLTRGMEDTRTSKEEEDIIKEDIKAVVAVDGSRELAGEQEAEAGAEVTTEGEEEENTDLLCLQLDSYSRNIQT